MPAQGVERTRDQSAVRGDRHVHPAEQAYTAELAHAARRRAGRPKPAGRPPLLQDRAVGMAQAARELLPARGQRRSGAVAHSSEHLAGAAAEPVPTDGPEPSRRSERRRWIALAVLCLGQLMIVLDATIVNVALPAIQHDLHFTQQNLTWVLNG